MSIAALQALMGHSDPIVAERSALAVAITEQYQGGGLDFSEYQELMRDLVRMDTLNDVATDMATKTMLINAVYVVAQLH